MAALLGPSWKSRQPRMCQYCQRMFSNKFNLKQVNLQSVSPVQSFRYISILAIEPSFGFIQHPIEKIVTLL